MLPRAAALVCGLAVAGLGAAGCATARASAPAPLPTLNPPDAPPRVVAEYQPDPPLPAEPVSAEAVTAPPPSAPRPRPTPPRPGTAVEGPQSPPAPPATAPPSLAMQNTGANAKAEQSVRALMAQAARSLERVVYSTLDADGRAQYDTARRFMQQADEALRARNVAFAGRLADKAAVLAAVLVR